MRCRRIGPADEGNVECDQPAAIGIVTEDEDGEGLAFYPICTDHAPEEIHEARSSMDWSDFAVVSLAYSIDVWDSSRGGLE